MEPSAAVSTGSKSSAGFHSVVVLVESQDTSWRATAETGYWLYGWLSQALRRLEIEGFGALHGSRTFSVSPLLEVARAAAATAVQPGQRYACRIGFLQPAAYRAWTEALWPALRGEVRLGPHLLRALEWTEDPAVHPLAARASVAELVEWGRRHADEGIGLRFLTPTLFKATYRPPGPDGQKPVDVDVPLPEPARLVASLAGRWGRCVPPELALGPELVEVLQATTAVARAEIRTEVAGGRMAVRGFVGPVELRSLAPHPEARAAFATLCRFAPFCGVGAKTAMGLGLVELASPRLDAG